MDSHRKVRRNTAENIISEHEGALLRYAGLILGADSLAQDAVETTFIKVLENREKILSFSRDQLSAELYRTVHKVALNLVDEQRNSDSNAMEAIRQLEPAEQQVVVLKVLEGKSTAEISRIVELSEERVARLLHKSVMNITDKLKKAGLL